MLPPSGNVIPAGNSGVLTQVFNISNPQQVSRDYRVCVCVCVCVCTCVCVRMYIHVCVCDLQLYLSAYSAYVFF